MLKKIVPLYLTLVFSLGATACGKVALPTTLPGRKTPDYLQTPSPRVINRTATPTLDPMEAYTTETIPPPVEEIIGTPRWTPTLIGRLTGELLRNMEYELPFSQKTVKLVDGNFKGGDGEQALSANISGIIAFGDLDGDKRDDAAFVLSEMMGSSKAFISLMVVTVPADKPVVVHSFQLGERELVNTIKIQDAHVILDMLVHSPNDQMCCPSQSVTKTFALSKGGLFLRHLTAKVPDGKDRNIQIEVPAGGTQVDASFDVQGGVTIAPFENTLIYRIYDELNTLLAEGPLPVNPPEPGAPGRFAGTIDLTSAAPGLKFRLEVLDLSAADGSILAMDSIDLVRK